MSTKIYHTDRPAYTVGYSVYDSDNCVWLTKDESWSERRDDRGLWDTSAQARAAWKRQMDGEKVRRETWLRE